MLPYFRSMEAFFNLSNADYQTSASSHGIIVFFHIISLALYTYIIRCKKTTAL